MRYFLLTSFAICMDAAPLMRRQQVLAMSEIDDAGNTREIHQASWCHEGVLNSDDSICCASSCGTCGGSGCSNRPGGSAMCCTSKISDTCTSIDQVACKVPSYPPPTTSSTTSTTTSTTTQQASWWCHEGVLNSDDSICCASSCGTCGGSGCSSRTGGSAMCCTSEISDTCTSIDQVACAVPSYPPPTTSTTTQQASWCHEGVLNSDDSICCASSCGTCGGSGCSSRTGGSAMCCTSEISDTCTSIDQVACKVPLSAATTSTTPISTTTSGDGSVSTTPSDFVVELSGLEKACSEAREGNVILIKDGVYDDPGSIVTRCQGSSAHPIEIKAETPLQVVIKGKVQLDIRGEFSTLSGIHFTSVERNNEDDDRLIIMNGEGHRMTGVLIDGTTALLDWVYMKNNCKNCRVDHNSFFDMPAYGRLIQIRPADLLNVSIDHNHFKAKKRCNGNGCETIQAGLGPDPDKTPPRGLYDIRSIIEFNLFEECNGELEIVSIKGHNQIVRSNTFVRSKGTLTCRFGHGTDIRGNYFLGDDVESTQGVRAFGVDTVIEENYFDRLPEGGIAIGGGGGDKGYVAPNRLRICNNTFANNRFGIYRNAGCGGCHLVASDVKIADNLFLENEDHIRGDPVPDADETCTQNVYDGDELHGCPADANMPSTNASGQDGADKACVQLLSNDIGEESLSAMHRFFSVHCGSEYVSVFVGVGGA